MPEELAGGKVRLDRPAEAVARLTISRPESRNALDHDVLGAIALSRATVRKMKQNLGWAAGYNLVAFPIAAGLFYPSVGLLLRPEIAALSMSGSSLLVALNALALRWTRLPGLTRRESAPSRPPTSPATPRHEHHAHAAH